MPDWFQASTYTTDNYVTFLRAYFTNVPCLLCAQVHRLYIHYYVGRLIRSLNPIPTGQSPNPVDLNVLRQPLSAINVGLESFTESLTAQGAPVVQVDWRPPAGGNERLMAILERMRGG